LFFYKSRLHQNFTTQPGNTEGHWLPPGFLQNRPGRRPGCGGNGFHVVIRCCSWFLFFSITVPEFSLHSLAARRAPCSPQALHKTAPGGCRAVAGTVFMLFVVFRRFLFLDHVLMNLHYTAWQLGGPLAATRLPRKPFWEAAGLWRELFSCGYS
jgi:hypothetical protein